MSKLISAFLVWLLGTPECPPTGIICKECKRPFYPVTEARNRRANALGFCSWACLCAWRLEREYALDRAERDFN